MKDNQNFIEMYKEGDFETRLNLFLECRHLRDEFVIIDNEEYEARQKEGSFIEPAPSFLGGRRLAFYPFRRLVNRLCGSVLS